jgi:fumarate reductase flavoprotein subunit
VNDVLVVGGGLAGMAAANRCAELGLSVAVLERSPERDYPCNTRYSNGAINCAFQDVNSDPAELARSIGQKTCGHAVPELAEAYARNAAAAVRWLRAQGVVLEKVGDHPADTSMLMPQGPATPGPVWKDRGPDVAMRRLNEALEKRGGQLVRGVRAVELVMNDGRCTGVHAEQGGKSVRFDAREVILCDGGFQSSRDLIGRYITPHPEAVHQRNSGSGGGDALRMALTVGARTVEMEWFYGHVLSRDAMKNDLLWPNLTLDALICAGIAVDSHARRFTDESAGGVPVTNAIAKLGDPLSAFAVCDEARWLSVGRQGRLPPNPLLEQLGGTIYRAGTLEELAKLAGLPPAALRETAEASGRIRAAPFYAIPVCAGISYTLGGILIDAQCRVVREDGSVIPGLRAAGSCTGGNDGGPLAGQTGGLGKSLTFGWLAANSIAGGAL